MIPAKPPRKRLTFTPTPQVRRMLEELQITGLYGKTLAEVTERLVCQALMQRLDKPLLKL